MNIEERTGVVIRIGDSPRPLCSRPAWGKQKHVSLVRFQVEKSLLQRTSFWRGQGIDVEVLWLIKAAPDRSRGKVDVDGRRGRHTLLHVRDLLGQLRKGLLGSLQVPRRAKPIVLSLKQEGALLAHVGKLLGEDAGRDSRAVGWAPGRLAGAVRPRIGDAETSYSV